VISQPISWWLQVRLLLVAERQRTVGRMQKAAEKRKRGIALVGFGWSVFISAVVQAFVAGVFLWLAHVAVIVSIEHSGKMVISDRTWETLERRPPLRNADGGSDFAVVDSSQGAELARIFEHEAAKRRTDRGGSEEHWRGALVDRYKLQGIAGFAANSSTARADTSGQVTYEVLGLAILLWWLSLVFQGEGGTLDSMRRRHPMWEWYLALPMSQTAVFVGEVLAPAIGNTFLLTSPIALAVIVGWLHGSFLLGLAMLPVSLPLMLAATLWAKALEVLVMLRSPIRSRGGWFAIFSAIGTLVMIAPIVTIQFRSLAFNGFDALLPWLQWVPRARWLFDITDPMSWLRAMGLSLVIGLATCVPAIIVMRVATARGLESGFGAQEVATKTNVFQKRHARWLRSLDDPLVQKELLWLKRDRGALVQLLLPPLILIATQMGNFHNMLQAMDLKWNTVAGVIVFVATSLLAAATPRALLSEGPGLMLTMSWPRSLEDTLRAKVRVLFALVTAMVLVSLGVVAWIFPANALSLLGVAALWLVMGLAVAEKTITNLQAPDSSGQITPIQPGRFRPSTFGNTTLALAILTAQWPLAIVALVMNWVFAAALWQSFRIRLSYLFDPECAPEVRPPSVATSVVAVVGLIELGALLSVPFAIGFGKDAALFAQAIGYGLAAIVVGTIVANWNSNRGLAVSNTIALDLEARVLAPAGLLKGAAAGVALGVIGFGYQRLMAILPIPSLQELLRRQAHILAIHPNLKTAYAIAAVGVAPWIEEFLFRGLLFRSMLPQWGLQRAAIASAAFFAIMHPWLAWPMVFALGYGNALLFARSRSLVPCMVLHACYNAVLLYLTFQPWHAPAPPAPPPDLTYSSPVNLQPASPGANGGNVQEPAFLSNAAPDYPREEDCAGVGGTVVLLISIDDKGIPAVVRIQSTSHNRNLDRSAVAAAKKWRFTPRQDKGVAMPSAVRVPVDFHPAGPHKGCFPPDSTKLNPGVTPNSGRIAAMQRLASNDKPVSHLRRCRVGIAPVQTLDCGAPDRMLYPWPPSCAN
jgi:TonB family protein